MHIQVGRGRQLIDGSQGLTKLFFDTTLCMKQTLTYLQQTACKQFRNQRFIKSTYGELDALIPKYVTFLKEEVRVRQNQPVILPPEKSEKYVAMMFAIMRSKCIAVPWHPLASAVLDKAVSVRSIPTPEEISSAPDSYCMSATENDVATMLFTSGTSKTPKVVPLTHRNIVWNIFAMSHVTKPLGVSPKDEYLSVLPWSHCYALTCELLYGMTHGARFTISQASTFYRDLMLVRPTLLCGVPKLYQSIYSGVMKNTVLRQILTSSENNSYSQAFLRYILLGGKLRLATCGGAYLPTHIHHFMNHQLGVPLMEGYGLTETSPLISLNIDCIPGSVGKVLPCNTVRIDPVTSEIIVHGDNVFSGYIGSNPRPGSPHHTGDLGRLDNKGNLFLLGRQSDIYKLGNGKFVDPNVIEGYIHKHVSHIIQVYVTASKCFSHNIAVVVTPQSFDEHDLKTRLQQNVAGYEIPKHFIVTTEQFTIENGLLTAKHTLRRSALRQKFVTTGNEVQRKN